MRLWPRDVELGREAGRMRQEWNDRRGAAPFFRQEISPLEASTRGAIEELFLARLTGLEWRNPFSEVRKRKVALVARAAG